jgi:hypothetical protein
MESRKTSTSWKQWVRSQNLDQKKALIASTIILKRISPPVTQCLSSLELHEDEPIIWYSEPGKNIRNHHEMCAIIDKTSEEFNEENNPVVNPANLARGFNYRAEAKTYETVAARDTICLMVAEWEITKRVVNGGGGILPDLDRRVMMGYQYTLHRQNKRAQNYLTTKGISQHSKQSK